VAGAEVRNIAAADTVEAQRRAIEFMQSLNRENWSATASIRRSRA